MMDVLLYANLALCVVSLLIEVVLLVRRRDFRFPRVVGVIAFGTLTFAYTSIVLGNMDRMPVELLRPGFLLFFSFNVARGAYDLYRN